MIHIHSNSLCRLDQQMLQITATQYAKHLELITTENILNSFNNFN